MAKLPAFAKAFAGRWRIVEMDVWDKDFLDLVETASGRGWVVLGTAGRLVGHFYIHNGDDSGFVCDRT
jgi:hypothetical protein